jgi:hypothetical protein
MIRTASAWLDRHPLEAMALGAAVAFVIMVVTRS